MKTFGPSEQPSEETKPRRLAPGEKLVFCGICDHYHPQSFNGDCRDDYNRFQTPDDENMIAEHFFEDDPN